MDTKFSNINKQIKISKKKIQNFIYISSCIYYLIYMTIFIILIIILHINFFSKLKKNNIILLTKFKNKEKSIIFNNILISIIVPVYNTEKWIEQCLFSILSQSIMEIEIICINDGSTDKSKKILKKFAFLDCRIIIINQENKGLAATRNVGLNFALGKYILFLDSDDMYQNGTLNELINIANKKKVEVIYFDAYLLFMPGMPYNINKVNYYSRKKSYGYLSGKDLFSNIILNESFSDSACLMMINRVWLNKNKIKFIEGIIYEDSIFSIQVLMKATHAFHINKKYYIYRIRSNSIMNSVINPINLYSRLIGYKEFIKIYENENLSKYQQKALLKYIKMIEGNIKYSKHRIKINEWKFFCEKKNVSNYEKILLILVSEIKPNISSKDLEKLWKLFNTNNIEIYGIGINCMRLLDLLNLIDKNESIKSFVIPNQTSIPIIKGKNIKILYNEKNIEKNKSKIVLILEEENIKEIKKLNNMGYKNIIILDKSLNNIILRLLNIKL